MFFVDYSAIRRFVVEVGVLLLFLSIVNTSPNGTILFDNTGLVSLTSVEQKASAICKYSSNRRERARQCEIACGVYHQCQGFCSPLGVCVCFKDNFFSRCELDCSNRRKFGCPDFCYCHNGGNCDPYNGACICKDGWIGVDCRHPCPKGSFGFKCRDICKCKNNADCEHISGKCLCAAGYEGSYCEEKCPEGRHGFECVDICKCQNDAICHHVDGTCECRPGWTGPVCAERCPDGLFGMNCSGVCDCSDNSTCNFITGECICDEGFYGAGCDVHCLSEEWGKNRSQKCNYTNAECIPDEETCFPGFHGPNCAKLDCDDGKWGPNCSRDCGCKKFGLCHPVTGTCCCKPPWSGEDCSTNSKEYFSKQTEEKAGAGASVIVAAICIPVVMLMLIVAAALFYRSRSVGKRNDKEDSGLIKFFPLRNQ